jgi:hypothetical protein
MLGERAVSHEAAANTVDSNRRSHAPPPVWGRMQAYEFVSFLAAPPQHLEIREEAGLVRLGTGVSATGIYAG